MIEFREIEGPPDAATLKKLKKIYESIFGTAKLDKFEERLAGAVNPLTVLALDGQKIAGFKIGYELAPEKFYSWIGGVRKKFREQGIGAGLMKRQHDWCVKNGFQIVRTKTMNRFKSMLILNIKNGFDIVEVYPDAQNELKIVLEKKL
jgi:predicted GNAT superfamily acetyltransferase